jgi:hypothetical protein
MGGKVADMQLQIAVREVLDDHRIIDRVAGCTPHVGYAEIGSR